MATPDILVSEEFSLAQRTEMSREYSAGNYDSHYAVTTLDDLDVVAMAPHERAAYVLGFLSSYELSEMSTYQRELFDSAYRSSAGRYLVKVAKYAGDRTEDYAAEGK